jgi:hypothetical protein
MLGPHISALAPVTRAMSDASVRQSARRTGSAIAEMNWVTLAPVGRVLSSAMVFLRGSRLAFSGDVAQRTRAPRAAPSGATVHLIRCG